MMFLWNCSVLEDDTRSVDGLSKEDFKEKDFFEILYNKSIGYNP